MLVDYKKSLAYICPFCSGVTEGEANIFSLSGTKAVKFSCAVPACRRECVSVRKKASEYILNVECPVCGDNHSYRISSGKFWDNRLFTLSCPLSGIEIFFSGNSDEIAERIEANDKQLSDMLDDDDDDDYLEFLDAMYDCLSFLRAEHRMSCVCGSENIEITMAEDDFALICKRCGRRKIISADEKTLKRLENADSLIIGD